MAKPIYLRDSDIDQILQDVKSQLLGMKGAGSIDIKKNFTKDDRTAVIYFTPEAWNRVTALVTAFDTEVQWHGCVNRLSEDEYEIYDIFVPPHVVTGASVTSDPARYTEWITSLDDNTLANLHFHGHSHVNMGCSPSSVDMQYRHDIATQLPIPKNDEEDSFYIFLIFNKKGEWSGEIYDVTNNALYSSDEIEIEIYDEEDSLLSIFIDEAKKMAVKETPAPAPTPTEYRYGAIDYDRNKNKKKSEKGKKDESQSYVFTANPEPYFPSTFKSYPGDDEDPSSPFYVRGL